MDWSPNLALLLLAAVLAGHYQYADANRACYGSVGGANGHVYQFDGGRVSTYSRGCQFLLARSQLELCHLELFATFGCSKHDHKGHKHNKLSRLRSLTVKLDGKAFQLISGRRLLVDGKPVNVPHSEHGIRAFYSGEDLVLVGKRCDFWVTFDGLWTATFRLGSIYRGRVNGLAGNCNGIRHDDKFGHGHLNDAYRLWKRNGWIKNCKTKARVQKCMGHKEKREAERACKNVIKGRGRCSSTDVLKPCMTDYCSYRYRPDLQKKILCANFYLHSRRCARHHRPLAWRHKSGCKLKCGRNQHFSRKANPCPKTCDNHFFGTQRRCYKLPKAEGCRCNKGFVLDGSLCVKPSHCECLAKLCIDRVSHSKCRRWKAQGRCRDYPEVMGRFCRLTCGMCRPRCRDQISTLLCKEIKRKGKCQKKFYRVMCQATCQPKKCGCAAKHTIVSKCSEKYKNKAVTTKRWFPDSNGRCLKSTLTRFYTCGTCPYRSKVSWRKCNYCKGAQIGKRLLQFREKHGERRCIRIFRSVYRKCHCPPLGKRKRISYLKCVNHHVKVKITKTYTPVNHCTRCEQLKKKKVLLRINCKGSFIKGRCSRHLKYIVQNIYQRYAHNCQCRHRLLHRRKIMCRCNRPKSDTACRGKYFLTKTTSWRLRKGRCIRRSRKIRSYIKCKRNYQVDERCNRRTCKAYKHISYSHLRDCKCRRHKERSLLGKCCCPRGSTRTVQVNRYWKHRITVTYVLIRYKCKKVVIVKKIRIACPRGRKSVKCNGRKGQRVFRKYWFEKRGNRCIKKTSSREVNIKCRRNLRRIVGLCHILRGNVRYRRVQFLYLRRRAGSCVCEKAKRVVKEMCGCRGGKFTRVTACPRGCTTKHCSRRCSFSKEFYYFKAHGKRCRTRVFKRLHFRCCCKPKKRVKKWCKDGHYQMKTVSYTVLRSHKCQRLHDTSSKRVRCRRKSATKRLPHPKAGYYYVATYHWYVSNCKCRVRVEKRACRKYCYKPKVVRFCDAVRRDKVTRYISWTLRGCKSCTREVRDQRKPVRCSSRVKTRKHCNERTGVLTYYRRWLEQKGCKCLRRTSTKRRRCRCPKPVPGRSRCNPRRNAFERKITYWVLSRGYCLKRHRIKRRKVKCSSEIKKKRVCKHKRGIEVAYTGVMRPKKCKCVLVWSSRRTRRRCNCNRENKRVRKIVVPFCDQRRNLRGKERFYYVLAHGKCVKRSRKTYQSFRCPRAYREKRNCDERRRRQLVLKHFTVKKNCRCVRLVHKHHVKCGCKGKRIEHQQYCKRLQGKIVRVLITRRWSNRRNICVTRDRKTTHRVVCRDKTRYVNSRCIRNKFYVETKFYYVRKDCKCVQRKTKTRRNCHCKNIVRRSRCPKHGYTRHDRIEIRRWDMKRKRCRISRIKTRDVRCRCPKNYKNRYCKEGHWVNESVRFILRRGRCEKKVVRHKQRVNCRRVYRHRFTSCRGCHRFHYTLVRRLQPSKCMCYFAVVKKRKCPCCCAKGSNQRHCVGDDRWERVLTHYSPLTGRRCGCRKWVTKRHESVQCSTRKTYKWLKCNRHTCKSHQQVSYLVAKRCKCRKRRHLTGKKRDCCCLTRPRFKKFCKLSSEYLKRTFYKLYRWRCVRSTSRHLLRRWNCHKKSSIKIGRCNRATCRQTVRTLVSVVARPHCRCKRIVRFRRTRPCCCNKRPHHSRVCERNCWVTRTTKYAFNKRRHVCVADKRTRRSCVSCSSKKVKIGKCNRVSCRQRITLTTYWLKDCQCQKRRDYNYRTCCCPRAKTSGPICRRNRYKVWYRTSYRLRHGRCLSRVKQTRKKVVCLKGKTRIFGCNKVTCVQKLRYETVRTKNCRCKRSFSYGSRTCCCNPPVIVNTACKRGRFLYRYVTTRTLNHRRRCVRHTKKILLHTVRNCRTTEKRGHCNKETRHLTVYSFHRKIRKCRCVLVSRRRRSVLCRCPGKTKRRGKCNKVTCHRKIFKTWFTSHGHGDKFKCQRHNQVTRLRCCCHKRLRKSKYCDRRTGAIVRRHTWQMFHAHSRTCVKKHSEKIVLRLACPRTKCYYGKCHKKTGYKTYHCAHYSKVRRLCRCKKRLTRKRIVCSCPRSLYKSSCEGHRNRVTLVTRFKLSRRLNRCVPVVSRLTRKLVCPKRHKVKRVCKGCRGVKYIYHYYMRHCKCKRKVRSHSVRCCCPKPTHNKRCLGRKWLLERFQFTLWRGVCKRTVYGKQLTVPCRRTRVKRYKCKGCIKKRVISHYHVRNCKCTFKNRKVKISRCCCSKPRKTLKCERGGVLLKMHESWTLSHGRCLKKRHVTSRKIICPRSHVKRYACNDRTRKQKILLIDHKRLGCRCVKKHRVKYELCKCRPSYRKAESCRRRSKRRVFRISFKLVRHNDVVACKPRRHLLFWEPCRCRKPKLTKKCDSNGRVFVFETKHWRLWKRHGRRVCISRTHVSRRPVRCQGTSISWTKCKNFRKTQVITKHRPVHCKCKRRIRKKVFACDCHKKNFKRHYCDQKKGAVVTVHNSFHSCCGAMTCIRKSRKSYRPIRCSRRRHRTRLSRKCGISHHYGWYSRYLLTWKVRQGCKCVKRQKKYKRLCRCKRSSQSTKCSRSGRYFLTVRYAYKRKGSTCQIERTEKRRQVSCNKTNVQVRSHGCEKCWRTVSISQCYVRSCRIRHYRQSGLQRCCTPTPRKQRYCDARTGRWVRKVTTYRLVPSKPLLKDRDGRVRVVQFKIKSRTNYRYKRVKCPRNQLRESCHRRSGQWRKSLLTWRRVGCRCVKKRKNWTGRCHCPPKQVRWGLCRNRYRKKTVTYFILKNHACIRKVQRHSYLCSCPKHRIFTVCDRRGHWKTCRVSYQLQFRRQRCLKIKQCRSRRHTCPVPSERSGPCRRFRRLIYRTVWLLNKLRCKCDKRVIVRPAECNCHKKRHSSLVCKHGAYVKTTFQYKQRGERCIRKIRRVTRPVYCDSRHRSRIVRHSCVKVHGRSHLGYQKLLTEWKVNRNCHCVRQHKVRWVPCVCGLIKKYRTKKTVHCVRGSVKLHKTIYYKLVRRRCIRRVRKNERKIRCTRSRKIVGKCKRNKHGDMYSTTRIMHRVSDGNCGCVWKLRSLRYRICKCRKTKWLKQCLHDRVKRVVKISYHGGAGQRVCRRRLKNRDTPVHCGGSFSRKSKCRGCNFVVHHFYYQHQDCKCVLRLRNVTPLKCCCPKGFVKHGCDASRHMKTAVTISYVLRHHACHRQRSIRTRRMRCKRKRPLYRFSLCKKGFRKIYKTVHYAVGCRCQKKTTVHRQRCSCSPKRTYHPGKCGRRFALDIWTGYKLKKTGRNIPGTNKPIFKCVKYVCHRLKRRCRCPKGYKRRICKSPNLEVFETITYKLRHNACRRKRAERRNRLPCSVKSRLVRKVTKPRLCSKRYGYVQKISYIYERAANCKCVRFTRYRSRVCDCLKKYGRKKVKKCVGNNRFVTHVTWRVPKGDRCKKVSRDYHATVNCGRGQRSLRVKRGNCGRNGIRTYRLYKRRASHCRCVWYLVRRVGVPCRCKRRVITKHCAYNHWVETTKLWRLVGRKLKAHCQPVNRIKKHRVPCAIGRRVKASDCNFQGVRHFTTTVRSIKNCHCLKRVKRRSCRCRCRSPKTLRSCHRGRIWVTTKLTSTLRNCACYSNRSVSRRYVKCKKSREDRGPCKRGRNGDKYRKLTRIHWSVRDCKCYRKKSVRRLLCGCDARRRVKHSCKGGNTKVTKITERRLSRGRCRRVEVNRRRKVLRCGRAWEKRICHKKTGRLSIFITKPYIKNCLCLRKVTRHSRRCGCHRGRKLAHIGKCNKRSCRQRLLYKKQVLSHERCIWKGYHVHRVCCCKGYKRSVKCQKRQGYIVTTVYKRVLKHWHCTNDVQRFIKKIKCKRNPTVFKKKLPHGVLKVTNCWKVRRGCKCRRNCKHVFLRYKCKKPVRKIKCQCSRGRCGHSIRITVWKLSRGRCLRQVRRDYKPLHCKSNKTSATRCSRRTKNGYYYVKTYVSYHQRDCKCHKRVRIRSVVCRCLPARKERLCHRGKIIRIRISYQLSRGRCVKAIKRRSHAVKCRNTWRLVRQTTGSPIFYKIYERYKLSGCKCVKQTKRRPCRSRCHSCTSTPRCVRGGHIEKVKVCWRLVGCRCVPYSRVTRKKIRCPQSTSRTRCSKRTCTRKTYIKKYRVRHCKCTVKVAVIKTKCCCPRPKTTRVCSHGSYRITRFKHKLRNGRCYSSSRVSYRHVKCSRHRFRAIESKCKHGKQKYSIHFWIKIGCRCVRRVRYESRKCACAHKAVELFLVVDLYGKDRRGYKARVVSFLQTISKYFQHTSARVRTTLISYNWSVYVHKLHLLKNLPLKAFTKSKTDLYGALHVVYNRLRVRSRSGVEKIVVIVSCGNHDKQRKTVEIADKIKRKASVIVIGFRPIPKSGRYVKWLASKPTKLHFMELGFHRRYRFSATRLFEKICKRACAKPVVKQSRCHRRNCRKVYTRITYHLDQHTKKCKRRSEVWWKPCCCVHHDTTRKECRNNQLYRVSTTYRFRNHNCHKQVHRHDISSHVYATCKPRVSHKSGPCRSDGWKKVTKVTRRVVGCRCRVKRSHNLIRCRCRRPHVRKVCLQGKKLRHCRYTYVLTPSACITRRKCHTNRVVCKRRRNIRGKCDRFSCQRSMGTVWYSVRNCKCKRLHRAWKVTCCCKRQFQKTHYCDKLRHQRVEVRSWLVFRAHSCHRLYKKIVKPVHCRSRNVERFNCVIRRGDGYYRQKLEHRWKKRKCSCFKQTKSHLELCRCRRGYTTKKCHSGSWIRVYHWWKKSGNRCVRQKRITSRQRVTCNSRRYNRAGSCRHVRSDGRYARVEQTWKRRFGCGCRTVRRHFYKLCGCLKPYVRRSCRGNYREVTTVYRYMLKGGHCKLQKFPNYRPIRCPKASSRVHKCLGKRQAVTVILHKAKRCKCIAKVYKRTVRCKSKCRNLLPTKICRKWAASRKISLCDKYPYFAKQLCARTCHRCYTCPKTRVVYAGKFCLSEQRNFRKSFILARRSTFDVCMQSCRDNKKCRAFDYNHVTRKCLLLSVNRNGFLMRFPWLRLSKTRRCILFERICPKTCPFRKFLKQYPCRCIKTGKHKVCYRKAAVATWKRNRSGKCKRRVHILEVPCRQCENRRAFCSKAKKTKCSKHLVRHLCNYSCGVCKREPRRHHHRGPCSKQGWLKETWATVYYDRKLHLWRVSVLAKRKRCVRCQVGSYKLIGKCKHGQRKITTIVARYSHNKCRISSHKKVLSCKGCSLTTRKLVSKCRRSGKQWIRKVVTLYTVRLNGQCVVRSSATVFSCSPKCSRDRTTISRCKCGKRIRCVRYYITYPGSHVCVGKQYTTTEECASSNFCLDKMRPNDCLIVKRNRMCHAMRSLCARTCRYCK